MAYPDKNLQNFELVGLLSLGRRFSSLNNLFKFQGFFSLFSAFTSKQGWLDLCLCKSHDLSLFTKFLTLHFVFQSYTQYIPLSIYDLQTWMGSPSIFVYDCNNAGLILDTFNQFASQREQEHDVSFTALYNSEHQNALVMR